MVLGPWPARFPRQGRNAIPAWGIAPGLESKIPLGLEARPIIAAMPQSLSFLLIHVVVSTKDRAPVLDATVRPALHAYLATVARNADCECYRVGGVSDHVHLAIRLSRTVTTAKLVEELKTSSSKWLKTQSSNLATFAWQRGYGAFSVGPSDLDVLRHYIDTQEEHHRTRTFQEEYRAFLTKYGVEYDERYVWD